jgi:hypothetical protein
VRCIHRTEAWTKLASSLLYHTVYWLLLIHAKLRFCVIAYWFDWLYFNPFNHTFYSSNSNPHNDSSAAWDELYFGIQFWKLLIACGTFVSRSKLTTYNWSLHLDSFTYILILIHISIRIRFKAKDKCFSKCFMNDHINSSRPPQQYSDDNSSFMPHQYDPFTNYWRILLWNQEHLKSSVTLSTFIHSSTVPPSTSKATSSNST